MIERLVKWCLLFLLYLDIDECASHSCQNSATCVDEINDYTCVCAAGYTDKYCQTGKSALYIYPVRDKAHQISFI
jgi:hypothetical protein